MGLKDLWFRLKGNPVSDVIKRKHRFVVMDTDTFKEKFSFQLSGINLFVTLGITFIVLIVLTTVFIAFTPLREWIPGYTNTKAVEQTYENARMLDSLEAKLDNQEWMIATLQAVLRGDRLGDEVEQLEADSSVTLQQLASTYRRSVEDSLLRLEVEQEDSRYQVKDQPESSAATPQAERGSTITHLFFTPLKGNVLTPFSASHYGVDIAGDASRAVCAAYSGTVVFAGFAAEFGYVIALQHPGNVVTVYRNNGALLKRQGDAVRAGEPIAYVGNSGRRELGAYLHFEIWVNGSPVNPEEYISFK